MSQDNPLGAIFLKNIYSITDTHNTQIVGR